MAYQTLIVEIEDSVALIRLNRPDAMNALNSTLLAELGDAVTEADGNDKVRCIVVTGSEKAFAAGADIKEMSEKDFTDVYGADLFGPEIDRITSTRKPIIAAVSGYALGGGCELAMACDFIICSDTAKFGQPEINLGVIAGIGGTQRLTRFVGKSKAMEMHLTGRFMDAEEADRSGQPCCARRQADPRCHGDRAQDRREINHQRQGGKRGGEPVLRNHNARRDLVRTPPVSQPLFDRRPKRRHVGVS